MNQGKEKTLSQILSWRTVIKVTNTVFYQINSGLLGIINEGLADIQEVIKGVSDEICPD